VACSTGWQFRVAPAVTHRQGNPAACRPDLMPELTPLKRQRGIAYKHRTTRRPQWPIHRQLGDRVLIVEVSQVLPRGCAPPGAGTKMAFEFPTRWPRPNTAFGHGRVLAQQPAPIHVYGRAGDEVVLDEK
jgi:hypothetical protein